MARRLNVDRMRRYALRSMPPPPSTITLTDADRDDLGAYMTAFYRNVHHDLPDPKLHVWQDAVAKWCRDRDLKPEFHGSEDPMTLEHRVHWRAQSVHPNKKETRRA